MDRRTESEAYRGHRQVMWFCLGGAAFLVLRAAVEALFGFKDPLVFIGGALAAAGLSWLEGRRQKKAERKYDELG